MLRELLENAVDRMRTGQVTYGALAWHTFLKQRHRDARVAAILHFDEEVNVAITVGDWPRAADVIEHGLMPHVPGEPDGRAQA